MKDHVISLPLMPPEASDRAFSYDLLFFTITALTIFFTLVVGAMMLTFVIKYRVGTKADRRGALSHSTFLELLWTVPPLILALGIFAWSSINFLNYRKVPKDGTEIFVIGKQWMWHLEHMNGIRENNELHIPVGKPVIMTMISQDVIHAMFLPDFRAQYHVVPGRYTRLVFTPTQVGKFKMLCAMHCGTQHSEMVGSVYVQSAADYERWLKNGGKGDTEAPATFEEAGHRLFVQQGCANCHVDQDTVKAPSLNSIFGTQQEMSDGEKVTVDEDFLRDKMVNPWRVIAKGYSYTMPSYHTLTEEQIMDLVKYMKTLTIAKSSTAIPTVRSTTNKVPMEGSPGNTASDANKHESAGEAQFEKSEQVR